MDVEQSDDLLAGRAIALVAALLVLLVVAVCAGVAALLDAREHTLRPSGAFPERELPRPTERSTIEQESFEITSQAQQEHARDAVILQSYGWVDRRQGIVRIPIDRAIDLYVAEASAR